MTITDGLAVKTIISDITAGDIRDGRIMKNPARSDSIVTDTEMTDCDVDVLGINHTGSKDTTYVTPRTHVLVIFNGELEWVEARLLSKFHKIAEPKGMNEPTSVSDVVQHDITSIQKDTSRAISFRTGNNREVFVNSMVIRLTV